MKDRKAEPKSEVTPFGVVEPDSTHVVLLLMGGDNNLSPFVEEDIEEMQAGFGFAPRTKVSIIVLFDKADAGAEVIQLSRSGRQVLAVLGEIDTGEPELLATVTARTLVSFPQASFAIGFWDHGSGIFDDFEQRGLSRRPMISRWHRPRSLPARRLFWSKDRIQASAGLRAMLIDDQSGGLLTNHEAGAMLDRAFELAKRTRPVELIFSDTCLNGMAEVSFELQHRANCVAASEELEPGDGWDYEAWVRLIVSSAPQSGADWGASAVAAMRAGYAGRPSEFPVTLAAVRATDQVAAHFKILVGAADAEGPDAFRRLDEARANAQQFAGMDTYDLVDFCEQLISAQPPQAIVDAARELAREVQANVVANAALGDSVQGAHGLAFWFPSSRTSFAKDVEAYRGLKWDAATGWTAYLSKYRDGRPPRLRSRLNDPAIGLRLRPGETRRPVEEQDARDAIALCGNIGDLGHLVGTICTDMRALQKLLGCVQERLYSQTGAFRDLPALAEAETSDLLGITFYELAWWVFHQYEG